MHTCVAINPIYQLLTYGCKKYLELTLLITYFAMLKNYFKINKVVQQFLIIQIKLHYHYSSQIYTHLTNKAIFKLIMQF